MSRARLNFRRRYFSRSHAMFIVMGLGFFALYFFVGGGQ